MIARKKTGASSSTLPFLFYGLSRSGVVILLIVFSGLSGFAGISAQSPERQVKRQQVPYSVVQGIYRNSTYRFEIKIPEGLVGLTNPLGSPDHGLEIPLEYGTGINIFAAYNALDRKSTKELWESELQMIKGSSLGIQSVKESAAQLCGWNAIHAIVEYARYTRPPGMDEVVVSLDQPPNEAGVGKVFVLHLHSTGDFFKNDRKWFEEVANSFKCFDSK